MSQPRVGSKEARELLDRLPAGFTVEAVSGARLRIRDADGALVRMPNGVPLLLRSSTPSDDRNNVRWLVARIRRAGVELRP